MRQIFYGAGVATKLEFSQERSNLSKLGLGHVRERVSFPKRQNYQTESMLALVLSCSFLLPNLDICRNTSTP